MDEDHLQGFIEGGRSVLRESGIELGAWLGAGGFGTVFALKRQPGRVVKFTAVSDEPDFAHWIMRNRAFFGARPLPPFLPIVHSVRVFPAGTFDEFQSETIWAIEREDLPEDVYEVLRPRNHSVDHHNVLVERLADKAYGLPTKSFRRWLTRELTKNTGRLSAEERRVFAAIGEALTSLAANGIEVSDAVLDNWALRGDQPVLRDLGYIDRTHPNLIFDPGREHQGGVARDSVRTDTYDED